LSAAVADTSPPAAASRLITGPWPAHEWALNSSAARWTRACSRLHAASRRRPPACGAGRSVKHTCPGREVHGGAAQRVLVVWVWRQAVRHREHTFHLLSWFAARARTSSSAAGTHRAHQRGRTRTVSRALRTSTLPSRAALCSGFAISNGFFLRKEKSSELVAMAGLARQLRAAATDHEDVDLAGYGQVASVHATAARAPGCLRGWTQVCSPAGALRRVALTERARGRRRRLQSCLRRPSRTRSFDRT
jgi:hypothetical protein